MPRYQPATSLEPDRHHQPVEIRGKLESCWSEVWRGESEGGFEKHYFHNFKSLGLLFNLSEEITQT